VKRIKNIKVKNTPRLNYRSCWHRIHFILRGNSRKSLSDFVQL